MDQESEADDSCKQLYFRRLEEVEKQLEYYKQKEAEGYEDILGVNKAKIREITANSEVDGYESNFHAMVDCVAVLAYQLGEVEIKDFARKGFSGDHTMTGVQSIRSVQQNMPPMTLDISSPVEIGQRLVIKYLNKTLTRLLQSNSDLHVDSQNEYVPNDEGDRAVWYLELLESQLGKFKINNI